MQPLHNTIAINGETFTLNHFFVKNAYFIRADWHFCEGRITLFLCNKINSLVSFHQTSTQLDHTYGQ